MSEPCGSTRFIVYVYALYILTVIWSYIACVDPLGLESIELQLPRVYTASSPKLDGVVIVVNDVDMNIAIVTS